MYTGRTLPPRTQRGRRIKVGTWLSLVERTLGVGEVASSNLVVPTIYSLKCGTLLRFEFWVVLGVVTWEGEAE